MQTKIIELKQAPVVLVELPVGEIEFFNIDPLVRSEIESRGFTYHGRLLHLTEEQFAEFDFLEMPYDSDYGGKWFICFPFDEDVVVETAEESFYSLLTYENVYTENPKGKQPTKYKGKDLPKQVRKEMYSFAMQKWQEAQSRTIDPTRTVVLFRKEG